MQSETEEKKTGKRQRGCGIYSTVIEIRGSKTKEDTSSSRDALCTLTAFFRIQNYNMRDKNMHCGHNTHVKQTLE